MRVPFDVARQLLFVKDARARAHKVYGAVRTGLVCSFPYARGRCVLLLYYYIGFIKSEMIFHKLFVRRATSRKMQKTLTGDGVLGMGVEGWHGSCPAFNIIRAAAPQKSPIRARFYDVI